MQSIVTYDRDLLLSFLFSFVLSRNETLYLFFTQLPLMIQRLILLILLITDALLRSRAVPFFWTPTTIAAATRWKEMMIPVQPLERVYLYVLLSHPHLCRYLISHWPLPYTYCRCSVFNEVHRVIVRDPCLIVPTCLWIRSEWATIVGF